jgi:hypothetical protein
MAHAPPQDDEGATGKVVDFDDLLFDACTPADREELLREAQLLASAFAPRGGAVDLRRMAAQLSAGQRDAQMGRAHARLLAATLKRLAKAAA